MPSETRRKGSGKLDQSVVGRPSITLELGSGKRRLTTPALIDTGTSISVISKEMAQKVCTQEGRPCLLTQTNVQVTSATGHGLSLCGVLEVTVSGIGSATFHVMRDPANHQCIIGWDMLSKYTFRLDTSELSWGTQVYDHVPYQSKSPSTVPIDLPVTSALEKLLEK